MSKKAAMLNRAADALAYREAWRASAWYAKRIAYERDTGDNSHQWRITRPARRSLVKANGNVNDKDHAGSDNG